MNDTFTRRHNQPDERNEETQPPHSRLFVVCSKKLQADELRNAFSPYGTIENLYMPRDRNKESKGVAYIKYSKTSEAALAMEEMDSKYLGSDNKRLKVLVATNRDNSKDVTEDSYKRLFIVCSKTATATELNEYFSKFGKLEHVLLQRDKATDEKKGFAYVTFKTFIGAAIAYEQCDSKYKAVFAKPRSTLKRSLGSYDSNINSYNDNRGVHRETFNDTDYYNRLPVPHHVMTKKQVVFVPESGMSDPNGFTSIIVTCSPRLTSHHIEKLFSIIPGMQSCNFKVDFHSATARITYEHHDQAAYAVEKLNKFEYPFGETIEVQGENNVLSKVATELTSIVQTFKDAITSGGSVNDLAQLADVMSQASSLLKTATTGGIGSVRPPENYDRHLCSVPLPPSKPLADISNPVAKRLYIVCKPYAPSVNALFDVFGRFGDLLSVYILPNKNYGFVKYASVQAADRAISTLNGATVAGSMLKVLEAEEKKTDDEQKDNEEERKRIRTEE